VQSDRSTMAENSELHAAYAVLGLSPEPSLTEAKTAFRVRSALLHPDVHQSAGAHRVHAATAAMQQLSDAYRLVVESLLADDPNLANITHGHNGMSRRCTNCRSEFQYTASDGWVACPRCGQGYRVRSRIRRSYSRGRLRAGRGAVYSRRARIQERTEPLGRLAHIVFWHNGS
jgi:DNA-directed RNA polymerase subunit RPC12/RpoP